MKYIDLAEHYEALEKTSKRLEKTNIIADLLKNTTDKELSVIILLLQGKIFPPWDETKIGVAARLILKSLNLATGIEIEKIEKKWKQTGDLGTVASELTQKKKQATLFQQELSVDKVFNNLRKLSKAEGKGSVDLKTKLIAELLSSAKPVEAKYIIRTIIEELRVGVAAGTLRDAIVWQAFGKEFNLKYDDKKKKIDLSEKDREKYNEFLDKVQEAYDMCNDFSVVAESIRKKGENGLKDIDLKVGIPIKVMLGPKAKDIADAFKTVGKPAEVEQKYDGFRLQIHKDDKGTITLFTRRLENVTEQFPDVVEYVKEHVNAKSFILDSEAVGFNPKTGKYVPFQKISQRIRRKYEIDRLKKELPVELNVFDIIYYNGKNLIKEKFKQRRKTIEKMVFPLKKKIVLAENKVLSSEKEVEDFFNKALKDGNEGLMMKSLDAPYKPGARVGYMVKLKTTMEPLDLVVVGAEWGEGKRAKWLSSFTVACVDEDGHFQEIGKVGTGFKETTKDKSFESQAKPEKVEEGVSFEEMTELLKPLITAEKGKTVKVKPKIVIEVTYEEIQKSPTYSSGYALRFPRVLRARHMERSAEDATTIEYVEDLYEAQKKS